MHLANRFTEAETATRESHSRGRKSRELSAWISASDVASRVQGVSGILNAPLGRKGESGRDL
jgi:hypothetical protein